MRTISSEGAAARWTIRLTLVAALLALFISMTSTLDAQSLPKTPHFFWGRDAAQYAGAQIQAFNQDGVEVQNASEGDAVVTDNGGWSITIDPDDARTIRLRLTLGDMVKETDPLDVIVGGFDVEGLSITAFKNVVLADLEDAGDMISVRIIAQRLEDGRIEFGMRGPDGEDVLPRARKLRVEGRDHEGWARSSLVDFGDGYQGYIIARVLLEESRIEFGFRVTGYDDDFLPRARKLSIEGSIGRWARSTPIEIPRPR